MGNDTLTLRATSGMSYNSNVLGVSDTAAATGAQPDSKDSWIVDYGAGLNIDLPLSRQRFHLDAAAVRHTYDAFSDLDYTGYDARASWDWQVGDRWSGQVGGTFDQSRQNVLGGGAVNFPALIKHYGAFFSASYRLTPRWEITAATARSRLRYDTAAFAADDFDSSTQSLTAMYRSRAGNGVGARLTRTAGEWPARRGGDPTRLEDYTQYTVAGVLDWRWSARSLLNAELGYTRREASSSQTSGSASGPSGQLTYRYTLGGKSEARVGIYRLFGTLDTVNADYVRTTGIEIGYRYAATAKLSVDAAIDAKTVRYIGGSANGPGAGSTDDLTTVRMGAQYLLNRRVRVLAGADHQKRKADNDVSSYDATIVYLRASIEF